MSPLQSLMPEKILYGDGVGSNIGLLRLIIEPLAAFYPDFFWHHPCSTRTSRGAYEKIHFDSVFDFIFL